MRIIFTFLLANLLFDTSAQNVGIGHNNAEARLDIYGDMILRSADLILSDGNNTNADVNSNPFSNFRISGPSAAFTLSGIAYASDGKFVTFFNRSGYTMTVAHESGTAEPSERILTGTGASISIPQNASINFQYDGGAQRWVVRSHSAPVGGVAVSGGWGLSGNSGLNQTNFMGTTDGNPLIFKQNNSVIGYFSGNNVLLGIGAGSGLTSGNNNAFILGKMRPPLTTTQNSVAIGSDAEISGDYQIIIGAPYHLTGIGLGYNQGPNHTLTVGRRYNNEGALAIFGTGGFHSHFNYSGLEDTYIRGGKLLSKVYINDGNGGDVIIGSTSTSSVGIGTNYPLGYAKLEVLTQPESRALALGDGTVGIVHFIGGEGRGLNGKGGYIGTSSNHPLHFYTNSQFSQMTLLQNGTLCIGSMTGATGYKLSVAGKIMAEEIRVQSYASWPDYVFKPTYFLTPLPQLEKQINQLGHLPNIPDAGTIEKEGITLGDIQTRMMEKIEELTLYLIEMDKDNRQLKEDLRILKEERKDSSTKKD